MPWPDDEQLPIGVYAAFGADLTAAPQTWVWTDLTDRLEDNPIPIRRGSSNGAGEASAGTCTVLLRNDDGELTPLHPASSLYPNVDLNTPIMVEVRRIVPITDSDAWSTPSTNSLGVSDQGRTWSTISAGAPVLTSDYQVTGGAATLSLPVANAYRSGYIAVGAADVDVVGMVSAAVTPAGGAIEPGTLLLRIQDSTHYYQCRVSVAVGGVITATIYASGASEQLATAVVSGVTWSSGVPLRVRAQAIGTWIRMRVWPAAGVEPSTWAVTATSQDYLTAGGVGFRDGVAAGNSNVKPVVFSHDDFAVTELPAIRMDGFADSWEPTFIPTSDGDMVSGVELTASGILRRLGQGSPDGRSALRRALDDSNPTAYWPMEDGEDSTQAASGLIAGTPMAVARNVMDFVSESPPGASGSAHPQADADNQLSGPVLGGSASAWQMAMWTRGVYTDGATFSSYVPMQVRTSRGYVLRFVRETGPAQEGILQYESEADSGPINNVLYDSPISGDEEWHLMQATFTQVGADTNVALYFDDALVKTGTWVGVTLGAPVFVSTIGKFGTSGTFSQNMDDIYVTHASVHNTATVVNQYTAGLGYAGEPASDRIARICADAGIPVLIDDGESEPLGPQPASRDIEIIRDAARADMGLLTEYLWGLRYRPRSARYNLTPTLTVDLATYQHPETASPGSILRPVYDDQQIRNDWTVERVNGSSAQAVDPAHAFRYGTYDDSTEINVATDQVLPDHAGWRLHLGTWQEMRYPTMPLHLEGNTELLDDWLALAVGDRVDRVNTPPQHPPGPISQIVGGYSETLTPKAWTISMSCAPYGPWEVATVSNPALAADETEQRPGVDLGDSHTLAAGINATALSFQVTYLISKWETDPADFPMIVNMGGEFIRVSAITGSSSPQTFTAPAGGRSVNGIVKSHPAGTPVDVAYPAITSS